MLKLSLAFLAGLAIAQVPLPSKQETLIVTTWSGDTYIAGQGDTPDEAWQGVQIPKDWKEIKMEKVWTIAW